MIIDLILDRKDGKEYNPRKFYNKIMDYYQVFPEIAVPIGDALDSGTDKDIKKALCDYIIEQGYNPKLCDYIKSVYWINI